MSPRARRSWVQVHLWLGLVIGLLWSIQGLTGSLLVFHRELDRAGLALTDGPMLPPSALIHAAETATGRPVQRLTAIGTDLRVIDAHYDDAAGRPQAILLDGATGRVVGHRERDPASPFSASGWRWIYIVHMSLMAGPTGRLFLGVSGLFLFASLVSGLIVGWPHRRAWAMAFSPVRWKSLPQKLYGWHRMIGVVMAIPLILLALTGAYMTFDKTIAPALGRVFAYQPLAMMAHQAHADPKAHHHAAIDPDQAYAIARQRFPQGRFMNVELPIEHAGYYSIRFTLPEELRRWSGRALVRVDATTGRVTASYDPARAPLLNRIDDAAYPTHMGEAAGLPGRILAFLAGLALPLLYGVGLALWFRKRRKAPAARPALSTIRIAGQ